MTSTPKSGPHSVDRELVEAMTACLQLMLEELRAQYRRMEAEAERLEEAGGAAKRLYERVRQLEVGDEKKDEKANSKRRDRSA